MWDTPSRPIIEATEAIQKKIFYAYHSLCSVQYISIYEVHIIQCIHFIFYETMQYRSSNCSLSSSFIIILLVLIKNYWKTSFPFNSTFCYKHIILCIIYSLNFPDCNIGLSNFLRQTDGSTDIMNDRGGTLSNKMLLSQKKKKYKYD